jgi:mono/diheme cytochrome c family protein
MAHFGKSHGSTELRAAPIGWCLVAVGCLVGSHVDAAPLVPGYERFGRPFVQAADATPTIESGLLLAGELGCVNCHAASPDSRRHLLPKSGPVLDKVGERIRPEWLVAYLKDPHAVRPGTTMPDLLAGLPADRRDRVATAIAHYLSATAAFDEVAGPSADGVAEQGNGLYDRSGCRVCHGPQDPTVDRLADQIPLGDLASKWSPRALDEFLKNPLTIRPAGRMPALPLDDAQRRHIVASLLERQPPTDVTMRQVVAFNGQAWHCNVQTLPAFESLGPPVATGPVTGFNVQGLAGRGEGFAVRLEGFFHAPSSGAYRFYLSSDDGSRLTVGDTVVIDHDGVHPSVERKGEIDLTAGIHPLRIDFFQEGAGWELNLTVSVPGKVRQSALAWVTPSRDGIPSAGDQQASGAVPFVADVALVEEGRAAFAKVGCANCHQLAADGVAVGSQLASPPLTAIPVEARGCMAQGGPAAGVPFYGLDDGQRKSLAAAIRWLASADARPEPTRERAIDRSLTALNSYGCHARDGRGGTIPAVATTDEDGEPILRETARDQLFASIVQELGDEGRLPPTLTGVGDKLRPEFLKEVLLEGGRDRRLTMPTLMPKWSPALAEPLAQLLAQDPHTDVPIPQLADYSAADIHDRARELVGSKGLGCIKCHSFAGDKGQSLGVVDMTRMPKRLRHEWFLAYVANPQQFRPGTRMPASWPDGKAFFPTVLDGTAAGQIEAVWRYVSQEKPRLPIGLGTEPIELEPRDRPIFYRNFIEGGGPRAIGVGYPGGVNIAWDAEALRTALVWKGPFIDARRHWSGRGEGWQPPLGDGVFTPDAGPCLETLTAADAVWPERTARERGARFRGYSLDAAGQPTFAWSLGGLTVRESFVPLTGKNAHGFRRTIEVTQASGKPPAGQVTFRVAKTDRVEELADGWLRIDGQWRVRISGADLGQLERHSADGKTELRYRVKLAGRQSATIVEDLSW